MNALVNHYLTADGKRLMLCLLDIVKDWARLCGALGRSDLICDERFSTHQARAQNAYELVELLDGELVKATLAEWAERFRANDVLWGPVPDCADVAADPQLLANELYPEVVGSPKPLRTITSPVFIENAEKVAPRMAPAVGEHTRTVLAEAGYTLEEIEAMVARGVAAG
jgi:crotonobetainyl-CoA:carnitine CoA-transferase CaiB-like acyl-CoA transferase